jgi:hypothetical protein
MSSLLRSTREVSLNQGFFIPVGDCRTKIYAYNPTDGQLTFSTASWANPDGAVGRAAGQYSTLVSGVAGTQGLLKDMGRTVFSSVRVFRRVQLVAQNVSTFGVAGAVGTTWPAADFLTGYIELGFDGSNLPTPVAQFGR